MLAVILLPRVVPGQEAPRLTWGPPYKQANNTLATEVIGIVPEGFYQLRQKVSQQANARPRAWIAFYDREMKLDRMEELPLKYKNKQRAFERVVMLDGQLHLLTSFHNTAKKRNYLFRQSLSRKTLVPSNRLDMICENEARNTGDVGKFGFHISPDSTRLLVFHELPYEKKQPERFGFHVYDRDFSLLWERNIVLPYPDNQFTVEDYQVDDQGNVYLLGVLYSDEAKWRRRGSPTYRYVVLSYLDNGREARELRIEGGEKFITDLTFRPARNGGLVCAGFYSEPGTYQIKGTTYFRIDPATGTVPDKQYQPFDLSFLTRHLPEKEQEKLRSASAGGQDIGKAVALYDYSLDELILRSDGGAVLVAEQFFIEQDFRRDYAFNGFYPYTFDPFFYSRNYVRQQTDYYYHYNDILVVNIRPDGTMEWAARVPKHQETRNDGGFHSSYVLSIVRDKLYFVYNDNPRNFNGDKRVGKWYNYGGGEGVIVLAQVNKDGAVSTWPLATHQDVGVLTRPKVSRQIGRRQLALFGEKGNTYRLGSLQFD